MNASVKINAMSKWSLNAVVYIDNFKANIDVDSEGGEAFVGVYGHVNNGQYTIVKEHIGVNPEQLGKAIAEVITAAALIGIYTVNTNLMERIDPKVDMADGTKFNAWFEANEELASRYAAIIADMLKREMSDQRVLDFIAEGRNSVKAA